ncbi:DUF4321 domain-containing protein [Thermoanaerobacterium sp. RBIITD]|uniref:DUF4321 domain-containing protein n=1 Tax=Thermoanaerobacterium sp. RBIITD TaxID=1550240 RepID=UPI000BB70C80|nr:DUF4321 domain-containing protein [Thermoanaerobacterium sp. RBIITD]SNX55141.1 protein of unknown function [Thermoanaerobacterium sp. RBIITD]
MRRSKGPWTLVFLLVVGLILGGFVGDYLAKYVSQLSYQQIIGMNSPISLDLNFIRLSFMIAFKVNIGTVVGLIAAIYMFYKIK